MQFNRIVLIVYILLGLINYSYATTEEGQTMIRYYKSFFTKYDYIMRGQGEILPEEINKYENYYKQETDEQEKIISFERITDKKCEFKANYYYDSLGELIKVITRDCEKITNVYNLDS